VVGDRPAKKEHDRGRLSQSIEAKEKNKTRVNHKERRKKDTAGDVSILSKEIITKDMA